MKKPAETVERFNGVEELSTRAAEIVAKRAADSVAQKGSFMFAISGGEGPKKLFSLLAEEPWASRMPWGMTHIFQVDERFTPYGSEHNNFHTAAELLLQKVPIPLWNIHRIVTDYGSPALSAAEYEDEIRRVFKIPAGGVPSFDLIQLGMGDDGHTASIFPGSALLDERRLLVSPAPAPTTAKPSVPRVTMTLPVLNAASAAFFILRGDSKRERLEGFIGSRGAETAKAAPASAVMPSGTLLWLCCP